MIIVTCINAVSNSHLTLGRTYEVTATHERDGEIIGYSLIGDSGTECWAWAGRFSEPVSIQLELFQ